MSEYAQNAVASSQHDKAAAIPCPRARDYDMVAVVCIEKITSEDDAREMQERVCSQRLQDRGRITDRRFLNLHQTPLNSEKYASWNRLCAASTASGFPYPGRGQKPAGMQGKGFKQTSSPALSGPATAPVGVKASTAMPRSRHCISPRKTGSAVHIPANREQMSVPPSAR